MENKILEETIDLLGKLVTFQSFDGSLNNDQKEVLDFILNYCEENGFLTKKVNDLLGWAEMGTGKNLIAFPVHLDVVPPGEGWHTAPFKLEKKENILYARGVYDNKGPASMMVVLVKYLKNKILKENSRIRIIFGGKEETGMDCIQEYVRLEEMPQLGFVPDALFPAVIGEKGRLHLTMMAPEEIYWIDEIDSGYQVNSVPDGCKVCFNNHKTYQVLKLEYSDFNTPVYAQKGISAHASNPEKGDNAFFLFLKKIPDGYLSNRMKDLLNLHANELFKISDEIFGQTTMNLGIAKYKKSEWHVELDIRFGASVTADELLTELRLSLPHWHIFSNNIKDKHLVTDLKMTNKLIDIYKEACPNERDYTPIVIGGGTYASYFPGFICFGPKFPTIRTFGHAANEQMSIETMNKTIQIYKKSIELLIEEEENK